MNQPDMKKSRPFVEIAKALDDTLLRADQLRTQGLQNLLRVRKAKVAGHNRELERLTRQLGEQDPRVKELTQKIEGNRKFIQQVSISLARAQIVLSRPENNIWNLQGRAYSKELTGVPNLTVGLYDHKGKWLEEFGYACTDKTGYFRLNHKFVEKKSRESTEPRSDTASSEPRPEIFIRLLDKAGVLVYIGKQPVSPAPGRVEYREIVLGDESDICAPPESSPQPPASGKKTKPPASGRKTKPPAPGRKTKSPASGKKRKPGEEK